MKKGSKLTKEHKRKIGNIHRGSHRTIETRKVMSIAQKGHIVTEETKKKIGESNKGNIPWNKNKKGVQGPNKTTFKKGNNPWNKNKKNIYSIETLNKMSKSKQDKPSILTRGEKHYAWIADRHSFVYPDEFNNKLKLKIRKRDNFTCQECKYTEKQLGYTLSIHHIDYNKKNSNNDNLISLCKSCHSQSNFNRNDWTSYYKNKTGGINLW